MHTFAKISIGLVYAGGPLYGYVVRVYGVVVLCACMHLYVDMLISSQEPSGRHCPVEASRSSLLSKANIIAWLSNINDSIQAWRSRMNYLCGLGGEFHLYSLHFSER
jgi:hypothetical protein